eukprot:15484879-Alexandrium_andersonii.AAC.1
MVAEKSRPPDVAGPEPAGREARRTPFSTLIPPPGFVSIGDVCVIAYVSVVVCNECLKQHDDDVDGSLLCPTTAGAKTISDASAPTRTD